MRDRHPHHVPPEPRTNENFTAPYNFVPLPEAVLRPDGALPSFARFEGLSGVIRYRITTLTPTYTRAAIRPGDPEGPEFFHHGAVDRPVLPGSSVRGMARNVLTILAAGSFSRSKDRQLFFRSFAGPMQHAYGDRMIDRPGHQQGPQGSHIAFAPRPEAGFLIREGDRLVVEPCWHVRIWRRRLETRLYVARQGGKAEIPREDLQHRRWWVKAPELRPGWHFHKAKNPGQGMYTWRTQAEEDSETERREPGWHGGWLVITGPIQRKATEAVFVRKAPAERKPVEVPEQVLRDCDDDDQITFWQQDAFPKDGTLFGSRDGRPLRNDLPGVPVWFLREEGRIVAMGRSWHFRLRYRHKTGAFVPKDARPAPQLDLAERVFGRVVEPPPNDVDPARIVGRLKAMGVEGAVDRVGARWIGVVVGAEPRDVVEKLAADDVLDGHALPRWWAKVEALPRATDGKLDFGRYAHQLDRVLPPTAQVRGRVRFSDARCTATASKVFLADQPSDKARRGLRVPRILGSPKPTAFQAYLVQPQTSDPKRLVHYDAAHGVVRGWKRYWHRKVPEEQMFKPVLEAGSQETVIRPVKAGVAFEGEVAFDHLSPAELGGLLDSLELPAGLAHRLGMGKPNGMGSVRLDVLGVELVDRGARYGSWDAAGGRAPAAAADRAAWRAAFSDLVVGHASRVERLPVPAGATAWETPRGKTLATMLAWDRAPDAARTGYVPLTGPLRDLWTQRACLPVPQQVTGEPDPWPPAPAKPVASTAAAPRPGPKAGPGAAPAGRAAAAAPARRVLLQVGVRLPTGQFTAKDEDGAAWTVELPQHLSRTLRPGTWVTAAAVGPAVARAEAATQPPPDQLPYDSLVRATITGGSPGAWTARLANGKHDWTVKGDPPPGVLPEVGAVVKIRLRHSERGRWAVFAQERG